MSSWCVQFLQSSRSLLTSGPLHMQFLLPKKFFPRSPLILPFSLVLISKAASF